MAVLYKFLLHKEDKETEFLPQNVTEFIVCNIYGVHDIGCKDIKVRKSLLVAKTHSNHAKVVCIFSLLDFSFIILFEKRFPYSEKLQCFFLYHASSSYMLQKIKKILVGWIFDCIR